MENRGPIVILLSGPTPSGKTTLAREIQRLAAVPLVHLEADRLFPSMSDRVRGAVLGEGGAERTVLALHRSIAAWAVSGLALVVDGSLPYGQEALRARCLDLFAEFDLRIVAVGCSTEVLAARERTRPGRTVGWAAHQATDIHRGLSAHAVVDTSVHPPERCARSVLEQLRLEVLAE